ncbi:hypothetical protein DSO57_1020578 [Entomophthora muscae]|uniref:Uncharacterized protein n=1 Tax=Entomophthora muscae TaxID=34485 RepID=A0ACC2SSH1_9FUNG|nr:hypothetical protein DSO57_1020578 [Entomophthora muscae]
MDPAIPGQGGAHPQEIKYFTWEGKNGWIKFDGKSVDGKKLTEYLPTLVRGREFWLTLPPFPGLELAPLELNANHAYNFCSDVLDWIDKVGVGLNERHLG